MGYKEEITQDIAEIMTDLEVQPILFVGSGISQRYFKTPTWQGLMKLLVKKCPELNKRKFAFYEQQYKSDNSTDYTLMASSFVEIYSNWAWETMDEDDCIFPPALFEDNAKKQDYIKYVVSKYFEEVTNSIDLESNDHKDEIESLRKIKPHAVITTNYDGALEVIFDEHQKIVGQQVIRANYTSYGEILKIHGCYEDSNSIVLTHEDYEYFNEKKKYLSSKLLTYFAEHPLFFLGYSLNDQNIINILSDIDEILASKGELVPNIYMVIFDKEFSESNNYSKEKLIALNENKSIRIKVIYANEYDWVYDAIAQLSPKITVSPKLLRSLLNRTYKMVTSDIPKRELPFNFKILSEVSNDDSKLLTLFGLGTLDNGQHINASFCYTLTELATKLGYDGWYPVHALITEISKEKGINIKDSDNKYHLRIKSGINSEFRKYSQEALDLLDKVKNNLPYELDMS
ncbi:hypothetical protein GCM10016272_01570 [Psychrobacter glaciei]|uniref:SIR2-like domain-containing protein n=1 Tax=Psychrobacter glaciei TaxID=619771 RepID=A0ABQ3GP85_9GAMM|nr:SIR2 family protein [Psychrobacter glaciei]GHD25582.1 hypothetical protein GCM10016272_01570 [Psychrobacter glaciei]